MNTAIMQATMTITITDRTAIMIVTPFELGGGAAFFALPILFVVAPGLAIVVVVGISTNYS